MLDMRELDPDDTRPSYAQVVDALRREIEQGVLQPGMKLPTHQQLGSQYGVSIGTVKRALGELQGAGLIISRQGQGAFVRTRSPETAKEERVNVEALGKEVRELRRRVELIGSHLVALYERVGQPYPYGSLNEVIEQPAADVAKGNR